MDLKAALLTYDGKHKAPLENIAGNLLFSTEELDTLCSLAKESSQILQAGSTWLLKRGLEEGQLLTAVQTKALLALLEKELHWEAQLHILQIFPHLKIPKASRNRLFVTLKNLLDSSNKFVKAWTFNGLYVLADQFSEYRNDVLPLLQAGMDEEAGSTKARIRNAIKGSDWM